MNNKKKKEIIKYFAIKCAWLLILFLPKLARIEVINRKYYLKVKRSKKPVIFILWHGRMLLPIYIHHNQGIYAMVSEHDDGEIIAKTILRLGYKTIRGSSTRGGQKAFRDMLRVLKSGKMCTILPDGPNGPRCLLKMGTILLAQRSEAYLLPICFSAQKPIIMHSWDRFMLWYPFSKLISSYGEPIQIPRKLKTNQLEIYRKQVEDRMNLLQAKVDEMVRS